MSTVNSDRLCPRLQGDAMGLDELNHVHPNAPQVRQQAVHVGTSWFVSYLISTSTNDTSSSSGPAHQAVTRSRMPFFI